jgi:hypothetical protein
LWLNRYSSADRKFERRKNLSIGTRSLFVGMASCFEVPPLL